MSYHSFISEEGTKYGSFEVWYYHAPISNSNLRFDDEGSPLETGWYWWSCFPGCQPDGMAQGPFKSEEEAVRDARGGDY